ncbi:Smr/MutS family protein [Syntrophomonas palmitatica]|uniref:Smr/MutS family protein n=1 Tax=Syntrophomonas palmitatica TaxID=402877 RepID=UPI0006D133B8|nr:Smr/MutS family protein [Syntrophomonas palmitatica]
MKTEIIELHGLNVQEALHKTYSNLQWAIEHGVDLVVINHGKGHHSERNFSVLKTEVRKMLKQESAWLREHGYRVIYGESDLPVALTYNGGQTLVLIRGIESDYIGDSKQKSQKPGDIFR